MQFGSCSNTSSVEDNDLTLTHLVTFFLSTKIDDIYKVCLYFMSEKQRNNVSLRVLLQKEN